MEGREPQHLENVNRRHGQFLHVCSSEEKHLLQYISQHPEILGHSLVQRQLGKQQQLRYRETAPYSVPEAFRSTNYKNAK